MSDISVQNISNVGINEEHNVGENDNTGDIDMDSAYTDHDEDNDDTAAENSGVSSMDFWNEEHPDDVMVGGLTAQNIRNFRHNSLALVTYPWTSGAIMQERLSTVFEEDHYAFVSGSSIAMYTIIN